MTKEELMLKAVRDHRHKSSGIILTWLGVDSKIHTKSIGIHSLVRPKEEALLDAKTELLLLSLDYLSKGYGINKVNSEPEISFGLSRSEAKLAYRELLVNKQIGAKI